MPHSGYTSDFSMFEAKETTQEEGIIVINYQNEIVTEKLQELEEFVWNDKYSIDLLIQASLAVELRAEVVLPNNVKYIGEWTGEKRHGRGTQIWPDGARYDGFFIDDCQNGFGRMIHADGEFYIGYWKDGKSCG